MCKTRNIFYFFSLYPFSFFWDWSTAMVNTLCANTGMKRICFFFEGEQAEWISGEVYWAGEFLYNPEM